MSPTVFRWKGYRFYFFSREEPRMHVHVRDADGQAKFWIEPEIELAQNHGLKESVLSDLLEVIIERQEEVRNAWNEHFNN